VRINPRTLNRYLQELTEYGRLKITGGNKYKTGYQYELQSEPGNLQDAIDQQITGILDTVKEAHGHRSKSKSKRKSASKTA